MRRLSFAVAIVVASPGLVQAQDAAEPESAPNTPAPLCADEPFHQFDFWLGDWDVSTPDGTIAGQNRITSEESGCLIVERWTSVSGGTGQSYNYYNPATQKWRQVWIGAGSMIDYEGGLTATGSMKLEGAITYIGTAQTAPFTGEWTQNEDGSVTQHFEQYDSEAGEWKAWFTGRYTPIKRALAAD